MHVMSAKEADLDRYQRAMSALEAHLDRYGRVNKSMDLKYTFGVRGAK
jgi:hypothetical protein